MIIHFVFSLLILTPGLSLVCNSSSYQFTSQYSLGKQDEVNRTFTKIEQIVPPLDFNYTWPQTNITYRISNFLGKLRYVDTNQKSQLVDKEIIVHEGYLRIDFTFNWSKIATNNVTNGTASGNGRTFQIIYLKNIIINQQQLPIFNLVDCYSLHFERYNLSIQRMDPWDEKTQQELEQILNSLPGQAQTLKQKWIKSVDILFKPNLNDTLHQDFTKVEKEINYTYNHPTKGAQNVSFIHEIMDVGIDKKGVGLSYSTVIKNYSDFNCGAFVPKTHRQTSEFGGIQQFMSLGVYKSTIAYAISQGYLDTQLNSDNWQSYHFQFYIGDLYDVIPALQKKYYPRDALNGNCKAQTPGFNLSKGSWTTLNVTLNYNCQLFAKQSDKILDIIFNSTFIISPHSFANYTDFNIKQVDYHAVYNMAPGYQMTNVDLANYLLNSTVHSLRGSKVFGSGFITAPRDYPHFQVNDDYIFIYDSANIH